MKPLRELLADADPLRYESAPAADRRDRLRHAVVDVAGPVARRPRRVSRRTAIAALVLVTAAGAGLLWPRAAINVAAAIRFEVRLAEHDPAPGLQEVAVAGTDRVVYLHPDPLIENGDIMKADATPDDRGAMAVTIIFSPEAAEKMRQATEHHLGRPLAILLDGEIAALPVVRSPIGDAAVISGRYSRAEAERIAAGVIGF